MMEPELQREEDIPEVPSDLSQASHVEGLSEFGIDPRKAPNVEQWSKLCKLVKALTNNPFLIIGDDSSETIMPSTTPAGGGRGRTVNSAGAFYNLYTGGGGDTYLQGGSVTGGNGGSDTIADYKVVDFSTGITGVDGNILYVKATCTGTVADEVLLPGVEVTAAVTGTAGTLPPNGAFTAIDYTGIELYVEIGRWTATEFLPAAAGNIVASGCIGNFTLARG